MLERVVGSVDLLDRARPRVTHHGRGPEDDRGDRIAPLPHQLLGQKLGLVVVVLEPLPQIQIVFPEGSRVLSRHGDGAGVRKALQGADLPEEIEDVARAVHIDAHRDVPWRREIVERRQVDRVGDPLLQLIRDRGIQAQTRLGDVAGEHLHALAPAGVGDLFVQKRLQPLPKTAVLQQIQVAILLLEVVRQQVSADEAAGARTEQCLLTHGSTRLSMPVESAVSSTPSGCTVANQEARVKPLSWAPLTAPGLGG